MPDLLLELLSEEIPARMQGKAADDLRRLVTNALVENGLLYEAAQAFATPRRLALHVVGLPARAQDVREERRGPRVGAPEAALSGFLKSAGLSSVDELTVVSDPKKGDSYVAVIARPGQAAPEVIAELLPGIIRSFPWPKSMRWGAASREAGSLRWVRPLQSILCVFASETESAVVPFAIDGIASGDVTRGHRFLAPDLIRVRRYDDYVASLAAAHVILDPARRKELIRHDARDLAFVQGLEVVEDEALLDEVAGLVEQPVVLMGAFEESFLAIPPEAIRATIRANQKCFVLRASSRAFGAPQHDEGGVHDGPHPEEARSAVSKDALSNRFILVSNLIASDGGAAIVAGNERVVRARLSDAKFFWDTDRKIRLEDRLEKLGSIVFHEKLGTQGERVERIAALARVVGEIIEPQMKVGEKFFAGSSAVFYNHVQTAARLCKADLVTEMVGEFPELQGVMGRYYALEQDEDIAVAAAIADHYKPLGPSDVVPNDPVTITVALADKLDTLLGFWAIGETPTGSKDPYALRRAALGVVRLMLENGLRIKLRNLPVYNVLQEEGVPEDSARAIDLSRINFGKLDLYQRGQIEADDTSLQDSLDELVGFGLSLRARADLRRPRGNGPVIEWLPSYGLFGPVPKYTDLLAFFHDRLKVYLRDRGARHDLIDAVLAANSSPQGGEVERRATARRPGEGDAPSPDDSQPPHPDDASGVARPRIESGAGSLPDGERGSAANDDLLMVVRRVEALGRFLDTPDGSNLLAATKRAANILRIEERKDGRSYDEPADPVALAASEETALAGALALAEAEAGEAVAREDFEGAMRALAALRPAVDAFFDKVTVNAPEPELRANRLRLLATLRRATRAVADFSRIEG